MRKQDFRNVLKHQQSVSIEVPVDEFIAAFQATVAEIKQQYPDATDLAMCMYLAYNYGDVPTIVFMRDETPLEVIARERETDEDFQKYLELKERFEK